MAGAKLGSPCVSSFSRLQISSRRSVSSTSTLPSPARAHPVFQLLWPYDPHAPSELEHEAREVFEVGEGMV